MDKRKGWPLLPLSQGHLWGEVLSAMMVAWCLMISPPLSLAAAPASPAATRPASERGAKTASGVEKSLSLEEVRAVQKQLKNHTSLSVDFTQQVYKDLRKKTSLSYGKAYFSKPNYFHWVLQKPKADEWIFDGKDLIHYQPLAKNATRYDGSAASKGQELRQIVDMVLNFDALLSQYELLSAKQKGDLIFLKLKPLKVKDIVSTELTLDLASNYISTVRLNFGKNHTTLNFMNPRAETIDASHFKAPAGVKVSNAL